MANAILEQPENTNFLSPVGFDFKVKKLPTVNYFVQAINVPSVTLGQGNIPTPFINIPLQGDHLQYGELLVTFKVDEDMANYIELYNWITYLGFPESFNQSKELYDQGRSPGRSSIPTGQLGDGVVSDATLVILNSAMNPRFSIEFNDIFPTNLIDLQFDTRMADIDYVESTCSFSFRQFKINKITSGGNSNTAIRAVTWMTSWLLVYFFVY